MSLVAKLVPVGLFVFATALGAQDRFLDSLQPAPHAILPYSESLAPLYEGVFPSGRVHPAYRETLRELRRYPAFGAALARLRRDCGEDSVEPLPRPVRLADYEATLEPGLRELAATVARAALREDAAPLPANGQLPVVLDVAVTPSMPETARQWAVQGVHAASAEWLLRPWLLQRAMARSFPKALRRAALRASVGPQELVAWLSRRAPSGVSGGVAIRVDAGPSSVVWQALERAGAVPYSDETDLELHPGGLLVRGRAVAVLYDERLALSSRKRDSILNLRARGALALVPDPRQARFCGWGVRHLTPPHSAEPEEPGTAPLAWPVVRSFAQDAGSADSDLLVSVFRPDGKGLYDKWRARSTRFRDPDGRLLLDGLQAARPELVRMELRARREPASTWAQEYRRPARLGDRDLYHHFSVLAAGDDVLINAPGAARAVGDSTGAAWLPGLLERDSDFAASTRKLASQAPVPPEALEAAARFDRSRYERDVRWLSGELELDGARLSNRANGLPDHQLDLVAERLAARYRRLGLKPRLQTFTDGGRRWSNLIVDLPGTRPGLVVLADHFDTAIDESSAEDGNRARYRAAPGADDNASGTAVLLEVARVLARAEPRPARPRRTIRLLHLTGEEFPADCLGARRYAEASLSAGERLDAFVVLDMIGWNPKRGAGTFQLNEGEIPESGRLSGTALAARDALARTTGLALPTPLVRPRHDPRSYLYNTDGVIFSDLGVPTLLFNESINRLEGLGRRGYHDAYDTPANIDFAYASAIARVALATVLVVSSE
ncbi:MAG: M20/M25/M40 family metallo-hydrolase [Candidatus Wallbacteria bacterium]|nr:M20/M25/M40 family metallo-hydrolase [Candidatus Wallbacteria bacterium]